MMLNSLATDMSTSGVLLDIIIGIAFLVLAGLCAFVLYGRYHFFTKIGLKGIHGLVPFYSLYILCKDVASMNWWWFLVASAGYVVIGFNIGLGFLCMIATFIGNYAISYNLAIRMNKDKNWTLLGTIGLPILIAWEGIGDALVYDPGIPVQPNGPFKGQATETGTPQKAGVQPQANVQTNGENQPPLVALGLSDSANPQAAVPPVNNGAQPGVAMAAPVRPAAPQPGAPIVPPVKEQGNIPAILNNNDTPVKDESFKPGQAKPQDLKNMFNPIPDEPLDINVQKDDLVLKPKNTNVDLSESPILEEKPIDPEEAKAMRKRRKTLAQREAEEDLKETILEELKGELKPEEFDTEKIKNELREALKAELKPEEIDKEKIKEELKASLREELKPKDIDEEKIKEELKASLKEELKTNEIDQEKIKQELVASLKEELKQDNVDTERIINELRASLKVELKPGEIDLEKLKDELRVALIAELKNEQIKDTIEKEQMKNELKEELKNELKKEALFKKEEDDSTPNLVENTIGDEKPPMIVTTPIGDMVEEKAEEPKEEAPAQPLEEKPIEAEKAPELVVQSIDDQPTENVATPVEPTPEIIATPVDEKKVDDALASIIESLKSINASLQATQPIPVATPVEEQQPEPVATPVEEPTPEVAVPTPEVVATPIVEPKLEIDEMEKPMESQEQMLAAATVEEPVPESLTQPEEPQPSVQPMPLGNDLAEDTTFDETIPPLQAEELQGITKPIATVTDVTTEVQTVSTGQTPSVTPLRRQTTKPVMPSSAAPESKFKQE